MLVSTKESSSARSWVRMVWAMAIPTLPTPMTEILVVRVVGSGGKVFWMGLKKDFDMSKPPGPKVEDDELFCISFVCVSVKRLVRVLLFQWLGSWN